MSFKKRSVLAVMTALAGLGVLASACDPTAAAASATQSAPPTFPPPPVDAGSPKADGGTSATDAGAPKTDAGTGPVDAGGNPGDAGSSGTPGLVVVSTNNHLPKPWLVTDPTKLAHTQPLDGGTEALDHVGQWVQLAASITSDNTVLDDDHCPNIFMNTCDGFAAKDSAGHIVLVDSFVLLGSGMSDCQAKFNGVSLPVITGVWAGRLLSATMVTSYSLALSSCAGVGMGSLPGGTGYAPATTDIQDLQANYPTSKPQVTVRGLVIGVAVNQSKQKTVFIEDPGGGPRSGIQVFSTAGLVPAPNIGDYVSVTGTADVRGDYHQLIIP